MYDEHLKPAGSTIGDPSVPAALSISEILRHIFKDLDNVDRATAACVCRTWVDVALDILWANLESPRPIMELLGPISYDKDGWDWDTGFPAGDWARFASYANRVRSFSYDGNRYDTERSTEEHLAPDVPAKLLYYVAINPGSYLLPQTQKLRWRAKTDHDLQMILPFLSPALRKVDIEAKWEQVSSSATSRLLRTLHVLLPHGIASLRFVPNAEAAHKLGDEIQDVIEVRNSMRELRVPVCRVKPYMLMSNLRVLEAEFTRAWDYPPAFFFHLSVNCPLIEDLRLVCLSDPMLPGSIRPLFKCSKLRSLDLEYPAPVDLQDRHIIEIGNAWRDLEALHISSRLGRAWLRQPTLQGGIPITSLVTFARAFSPKLRKLAINLNSSNVPLPPDPPVRFPNLEFFSVGTSHLSPLEAEQRIVARFLGSVLPLRMDVIHSNYSSDDTSRSVFELNADGRGLTTVVWNKLSEMLCDCRKAVLDQA